MITVYKDKRFIAVRDDGQTVEGIVEDGIYFQLVRIIESVKTEEDKEKEKLEKIYEKLNEKLSDAEKLENIDLYPKLIDGMQIVTGHYYSNTGELWRAKDTFIYTNQHTPILEPNKWEQIGKKELSEYEKHYKEAKAWNRDETFEKGAYVIWHNVLYVAAERIADNAEPGKDSRWEVVPNDINK